MQLLLIIHCKGCGATLIPVNTDTAWIHSDESNAAIDDIINRHRMTEANCPYYIGPELTDEEYPCQ